MKKLLSSHLKIEKEMKRDIALLLLGFFLSGFTMMMFGQNGDCSNANGNFNYIASIDNPTFESCITPPIVALDGTITTYHTVTSSATGTLGAIQSIWTTNDCTTTGLWSSRVGSLYAANDCDGTVINPTTANAGYSSTFNPEWTNLTPNTNYILKIQMTVEAGCTSVNEVCLDIYYPAGCTASAGTYTVTTDGTIVSVGQEYTLTEDGQSIDIANNGDFTNSPDAFSSGDATSGFLIFNQAPPSPIDPNNLVVGVDGFLGAYAGNSINDAMASGSSQSVPGENTLWFVPTTFDTGGNGGSLYVDSDGDGCFDMGTTIQVNYTTTPTQDCGDCNDPACSIYYAPSGADSPSMTYPGSNHIDVNLNGPATTTQCYSITVENNDQTLGFRQSVYQANVGCANRTYTLHAADANGQCTGSPIAETGSGPYSGVFNPEWDYLPAGEYILCITQDLPAGCDIEYTNTGYYLEDLPVQPSCNAAIGTYTVTTDGTVVTAGEEYTLTEDGQTIDIANNGDVTNSPDANALGDATSGFLIFNQAPPSPIDPNNLTVGVDGFLGAYASNNIDDAMASGSSQSVPGETALWFVPATFDTGGNGGALYVDSDGDGCYELGDAIQVNYNYTPEYNCGDVDFTISDIGPFDCTDGIVDLTANDPPDVYTADQWIYPGFLFYIQPENGATWNNGMSVELYINGVVVFSFIPSDYGLSGQDIFIIPITFAQPENFAFGVSYAGGNGTDFNYLIVNTADNTVAESGLWTIGGTTVSADYLPIGTATFSGPGVSNDPDNGGKGFFDPSVAGPGTHTITYSWDNGSGCSGTMSYEVTVNGPDAPTATDEFYCLNQNANALSATGNNLLWYTSANGGTGSTTAPTPDTGAEGVVSYWVSDSEGACESQRTEIEVTVSGSLTVSSVNTDVNCNGLCEGAIDLTVQGGSQPYSYSWDNGATTEDLTDLCANDYEVFVSDAAGCSATYSTTIEEPSPLSLASASTDASCSGTCDGTINVIPSGGINQMNGNNYPYTIEWYDSNNDLIANSAYVASQCAGDYTVIVTDDNGCTSTASETINSNSGSTVAVSSETHVSCFGGNDGEVILDFSNPSVGPFEFSLDGTNYSPYTGAITGLTAGTFDIYVQDSYGCTAQTNSVLFQPNPVNIDISSDTTICEGGEAHVWAYAYGGVPSYTFSWDNGSNTSYVDVAPANATTYSVTAYDSNGCPSETVSSTVRLFGPLTLSLSSENAMVCPGEEVTIDASTASGGSGQGYSISWTPTPDNTLNPQQTSVVYVPVGNTTVTAVLTDNCETPSVSATISIGTYDVPEANLYADEYNGCGEVNVTFNSDLSTSMANYDWSFGNGLYTSTQENPTQLFNEVGVYDVSLTYTTQDGCLGYVEEQQWIEVFENPTAIFTSDPSQTTVLDPNVNFDGTESFNALDYLWTIDNNGVEFGYSSTATYSFEEPGVFDITLLVTTENGCTDDVTHSIVVEDEYTVYAPTGFSPNNDGKNDFFKPLGIRIDNEDYRLWIYDRWGNLVFFTDDYNQSWDGTLNNCENCTSSGEVAPIDVYVWIAQIRTPNGIEKVDGHVTLIK